MLKERWVSPILDILESAPILAGCTDPGDNGAVIIVGSEGSINIALEIWKSILFLGQPWVHALPSCGAARLVGNHGLDELPCPDHQPNLIWIPAVVLVPRVNRHGQRAGPSEAASQPHPHRRLASHGSLCIDSGRSFWFFLAAGVEIA